MQMDKVTARENWQRWREILDRVTRNPHYSAKLGIWGTPRWKLACNLSKFAAVQLGIYNEKVWR